jgi:hypothetical protein
MTHPSVEDVDRIASIADPVLRNLQITQCYGEISRALRSWTGATANWCTFATWASKQAGQSIRGEDLVRHFQDRFHDSPEITAAVDAIVQVANSLALRWEVPALLERVLPILNPATAFARASDAVARGNRKVFQEIGREFVRFLATFATDSSFDAPKLSRFCAGLRPGDPPDGQRLLRDAFTALGEGRFLNDSDAKSERLLYANLLAGFHEQRRLQPEITEAMNASFDAEPAKRSLLGLVLPGFWIRWRHEAARRMGRPLPLDTALDHLLAAAQRLVRQVITHHLMTLHLPGEGLQLGSALPGSFPPPLAQIDNPHLKALLTRIDPTPDSVAESGARDWAEFNDRMHFITDFFRCYLARNALFDAPFTDEQVADLRAGRRPAGAL